MTRTILVFRANKPNFTVDIPEGARLSFGPWTPPRAEGKYGREEKSQAGTLRIYEKSTAASSILAVFSDVEGYRDLSLNYSEIT